MSKLFQVLLTLAALAVAVGIFMYFLKTKPTAAQVEPVERSAMVEVQTLQPVDRRVTISAKGTVIPTRTVVVQSEVGGRVLKHNKRLVPGGRFKKGEVILRIDPRDYQLALEREKAMITAAEFQLKLEQGNKAVAEYEWGIMKEEERPTGAARELALRTPHIKNMNAALAAAKSGIERARLNVTRTVIRAPFNAMVRDESVEVGQLVSPQNLLATLVGTDAFWVQISVPVDRLDWIEVPGLGAEQGSMVKIFHEAGSGQRTEHQGRVVRLLGDLDPRGRMAQLVVSVADPLGLKNKDGEKVRKPLLLGSYVSVEIPGRELAGVFEIPRGALRDDDRVWLMDGKSRLQIRSVNVLWRGDRTVYVDKSLASGEILVLGKIPAPMDGMLLKPVSGAAEAPVKPAVTAPADGGAK
jgi:RND family efflux transporter MFP subunit